MLITITRDDLADQRTPLESARSSLEEQGRAELETEGFVMTGLEVRTILDIRYLGQSYELAVATDSLDSAAFAPAFHETHRERYGHADETRPIEVVNLRLKLVLPPPAAGAQGPARLRPAAEHTPNQPEPIDRRQAFFNGSAHETPIYGRGHLHPGHEVDGPGVIVQMDSTTIIPPGWRSNIDAASNLILEHM